MLKYFKGVFIGKYFKGFFSLEYFFYLVPPLATKRTYGMNIKINAISRPGPDFSISVLHSFRANFSAAGLGGAPPGPVSIG